MESCRLASVTATSHLPAALTLPLPVMVVAARSHEKDKVAALVQAAMQNAVQMEIPLLADVNFGKNWAETK